MRTLRKLPVIAALLLALAGLGIWAPAAQAGTVGHCTTSFSPRPVLHPPGWDTIAGHVQVKCSERPRSFLMGLWLEHKTRAGWIAGAAALETRIPGTTYTPYNVAAECRDGLWRLVVHASTTDALGYHQLSVTSNDNYVANCPAHDTRPDGDGSR